MPRGRGHGQPWRRWAKIARMSILSDRRPLARGFVGFNYLVGVTGLAVLTAATLLRFGSGPGQRPPDLELHFAFLALFVLARWLRFEVPPNITASLVVPLQLAAVLLLGPVPTAWLVLPAFLIEVVRERPLQGLEGWRLRAMIGIIAFNLGMEALITLAAGACWLALRPDGAFDTSPEALFALVATFVVFKGVNELLMVTGIWLRGVELPRYLVGARTTVVIETLSLPLAALLVLLRESPELSRVGFYLFVGALVLAAVVVRSLTHTRVDLERRVREIETVSDVGRAISLDMGLERLLQTVYERCSAILPSGHFYIAIWNEGDASLRIALEVIDGERQEPHDLPLGEGLTSHVIQSRRALLVGDLIGERESLPAEPVVVDSTNRSWLGVPMIARGEVVGAIVLQHENADQYDENDLRVLDTVASQAAISIMNARLHREALNALRIEAENRELKALNAKKSDFVNMVSHQFRTPLNAVIGYTNLLLERARRVEGEPDVPDLERHLDTVHGESRRLAQMVEELLNLSRIRAGHLPLTLQTFDVNAVVRETLVAHELLAAERGLSLVIEGAGVLPARGDSNFIRQVLGNLVANAVKYAPEDSTVTVRSRSEGGGVLVEVEDEGPGVPPEDLERIFDEFYRAPGETLDKPGTGLGLSICRGILEAHSSPCWAERRGGGTAFCFRLPAPGAADTSERDAPAAAAGG